MLKNGRLTVLFFYYWTFFYHNHVNLRYFFNPALLTTVSQLLRWGTLPQTPSHVIGHCHHVSLNIYITCHEHRGQTSEHAREIAGTWNSVCPRQVSNFCGLDKSTIPPVYLQLSTTLYRPSWAAVHNIFFLSASSLPLYIFFRWSRSVTTTVNKSQRRQAFACRLF